MKKSELREIIKPMVEECLQESMQKILLESGLLSAVISEVVAGLNTAAPIVEQRQEVKAEKKKPANKEINTQKINETRKRMLDAIGKEDYEGSPKTGMPEPFYHILNGHHRFLAAQRLGMTEVPVVKVQR